MMKSTTMWWVQKAVKRLLKSLLRIHTRCGIYPSACPTSKTNQILVNKRFLSPTMIHILPNGFANISQLPLWNGPPIKLKNSTIHQKLTKRSLVDLLLYLLIINHPICPHHLMTISIRPIIGRLGVSGVSRATPGSPCRGEHLAMVTILQMALGAPSIVH